MGGVSPGGVTLPGAARFPGWHAYPRRHEDDVGPELRGLLTRPPGRPLYPPGWALYLHGPLADHGRVAVVAARLLVEHDHGEQLLVLRLGAVLVVVVLVGLPIRSAARSPCCCCCCCRVCRPLSHTHTHIFTRTHIRCRRVSRRVIIDTGLRARLKTARVRCPRWPCTPPRIPCTGRVVTRRLRWRSGACHGMVTLVRIGHGGSGGVTHKGGAMKRGIGGWGATRLGDATNSTQLTHRWPSRSNSPCPHENTLSQKGASRHVIFMTKGFPALYITTTPPLGARALKRVHAPELSSGQSESCS